MFIERLSAKIKGIQLHRSHLALLVPVFLLILAALIFTTPATASPSQYPAAANTATPTVTNTPTLTPTPTNTPIATPLPMIQSSGYTNAYRCGAYGVTPTATGDCFQAQDGGGLSAYSAAGGQVFHVNGETGQINTQGGIVAVGTVTFNGTVVPLLTSTPQPTSTPGAVCQKVNVAAGSATLAPGTFPTAVSMGVGTLNGTYTTDNGGGVQVTAGSGAVTVNVYQRWLSGTVTPQPATTTVAVAVCTQ